MEATFGHLIKVMETGPDDFLRLIVEKHCELREELLTKIKVVSDLVIDGAKAANEEISAQTLRLIHELSDGIGQANDTLKAEMLVMVRNEVRRQVEDAIDEAEKRLAVNLVVAMRQDEEELEETKTFTYSTQGLPIEVKARKVRINHDE